MSKKNSNDPAQLRSKAETKLALMSANDGTSRSVEEHLHELEVYQIELEMLNEKLRQAQIELEKSRDLYVDFYDFSPRRLHYPNPRGYDRTDQSYWCRPPRD
jgi:hypothetical protein